MIIEDNVIIMIVEVNVIIMIILVITSVAATKLSSKFHAKVSRNFWHESLNLFEETFP